MEQIKYRITLDAKKGGSQQKISGFYKGERGKRIIEIILVSDSDVLCIDNENTVIVYGEKADGSMFMQSCEAENGKVIFEPLSSVFSVIGDVQCQVQILSADGDILYSPSFTMVINDTVRNGEAIESSDEFSALDEALKEVQELKPLIGADVETLKKLSEDDGTLTYDGKPLSGSGGIEFVEKLPDGEYRDKIVFLKNEYQEISKVSELMPEKEYSLSLKDFEFLNVNEKEKNLKFTNKELLNTLDYTYAVVFNFSEVSETVKNVFVQATDGALLPDGSVFWVWAEESMVHELVGPVDAKKWYKFDGSALTLIDLSVSKVTGCYIKESDITDAIELESVLLNVFDVLGVRKNLKGLYYTENGAWKILAPTTDNREG